MITKIHLNKVASYKNATTLETDKKVNLIYGLNGTGKSTLSNLLYKPHETKYKNCSIEGLDKNDEVIVYNQLFIQENFFESERLKGIFTLSKENKEAKTKIDQAEKEIKKLEKERLGKEEKLKSIKEEYSKKEQFAKNKIWEIKQNYAGGDRVLEFCLRNKGLLGDRNKLLSFITSLPKPEAKPKKSIENIKKEVLDLKGENSQKFDILSLTNFQAGNIETDSIFNKEIVGNENSTVASLIKKLGNSDWVKNGLKFIPDNENLSDNAPCPFCQEKTISNTLINNIKDFFDSSYDEDLSKIKEFYNRYSSLIDSTSKSNIVNHPKIEEYKKDFEIQYNAFEKIILANKKLIEDKLKYPSRPVTLNKSIDLLKKLNEVISIINENIKEHNKKIEDKDSALQDIQNNFWEIMRWEYDQTISSLDTEKSSSTSNVEATNKEIQSINKSIETEKSIIVEQQRNTVNIEEAINNINNCLIDLGIDDFKIVHHSENLYTIVRGDSNSRVFRTLSEGEKMIISFLYFLELARGKRNAQDAAKKKIVVIDDPISSLSHVYVFNVGRLIHNEFLRSGKYDQIFILTHSLYFFYELADTNHDRRKDNQKLFRLRKNTSGSEIIEMKYEEIQNDYHAYWSIIKDKDQHPALIANCMRNVIEYFFNFVEKKDLNNFFQQPSMQAVRFQAFCRYINRESHSLGQNIFDIKEFNYDDFKDAFALLFKENGYEDHYKKMIK